VVIDHCGRIDPREGEDQAAMRAILDLLETGRGWIKLISYRSLPPGGRGDEMVPFLRRFAAAAPERCLWGTDWPHPLMANKPDTRTLLDAFSGVFDGEPPSRGNSQQECRATLSVPITHRSPDHNQKEARER
jgi:predicted TIM-barrel fold metal-dependent hydrolase